MKILIITPLYPPIVGGVSTFCFNLASHLKQKGNEVKVANKSSNKESKYRIIFSSFFASIKFKPNVIHAHGSWHALFSATFYKRLNKNVKVIFTFHTWGNQNLSQGKKKKFEKLLSKCDAITFVSQASKQEIEKDLEISTKKYIVYAGVDVKIPEEKAIHSFKKAFLDDKSSPIITAIGPFEWREKVSGIMKLIEGFPHVISQFPNAKLILVGDGQYKSKLEGLVKSKKLDNHVIFTGYYDAMVPLYLTDVYTHISLQEGLPIAILEAMAMKKPIIATSVGGIPEAIQDGENGLLVTPDPPIISKAIVELLNNEELKIKLAENAYETAMKKFNWNKTVSEFLRIYGV